MFFKLCLSVGVSILLQLVPIAVRSALCLPPSGDPPEEVLRTEIITQARSPIDGKPLTASEYAQLQAKLAAGPAVPKISPEVRNNIFRLRLLKLIRTFAPFLPLPK